MTEIWVAREPIYCRGNQPSSSSQVRQQAARDLLAADSAGTSDTGGCVVATHAVNSGAFTPAMKREAVVWCMKALHGKWWGEAVRRGYRLLRQ